MRQFNMKPKVLRKLSSIAILAGASLLYGCGNAPVGGIGFGQGQFAAGCAPINGPIAFSTPNGFFSATNIVAQNMPAGGGQIGMAPINAAPNQGFGLLPFSGQRNLGSGTVVMLNAQPANMGVNNGFQGGFQGGFQNGGGALISGMVTLSPAIVQSAFARWGNVGGFNQQPVWGQPTNWGQPNNFAQPVGMNGSLCAQAVSLSAVVNAAASGDARLLSGQLQVVLSNGHSIGEAW